MSVSKKAIGLKELEWCSGYGEGSDKTCLYANGHIDKAEFLTAVKACRWSDVPQDAREALTLDDVQQCMFRRMSPSEARARGYDSGMLQDENGKMKVTMVIL